MSDFQHTTGPWFLDPSDETVVVIDRRPLKQKFSVLGHSEVADAEDYANARLIAAAPDLLESLGILLANLESELECDGHDPADDARIKMARAAIAKATGT